MNNTGGNPRKKGGVSGVFIVFAILVLLNLIGSGGAAAGIIAVLLIAVAVIGIIAAAAKKAKNRSTGTEAPAKHKNRREREAEVEDKVYVPLHEDAPQKAYYESSDVFDNRQHDKERRIAQLKVFLENGIIDKTEYRVLLDKYERES